MQVGVSILWWIKNQTGTAMAALRCEHLVDFAARLRPPEVNVQLKST
ncbi:hypothetical protein [Lishizhenia sp.]|nr:hypothetical protein [Lishizhenia sp.]